MEANNKQYDEIVATIMANVLSERKIAGKIVLWDFQSNESLDRLYFNVASIVSDMEKERTKRTRSGRMNAKVPV